MKKVLFLLIILPYVVCGQWIFNPKVTSKSYYESGRILSEIDYRSGKRNGNYIFYFENGNKQSESYYLNGKLKGEYKFYYETGELKETGEYIYDDNNIYSRKNGSWKTYYKDGKLKSEAIIENGITTLWKTYNRNRENNDGDLGC